MYVAVVVRWRAILRTAKTEALKKEVEILAQNHEREVDRKDAILQMLDRFFMCLQLYRKISIKVAEYCVW